MEPDGVNVIGYLSSEKGLGEAVRGLVRAPPGKTGRLGPMRVSDKAHEAGSCPT